MRIAVIGAGISGLAAAYFMRADHDVYLFEANDYAGGHAQTIIVSDGISEFPIDTGFITYNTQTYPGFSKMLNDLDVPTIQSDMSLGFSCGVHDLEYSSRGIRGIFSQPNGMLRPKRLRMGLEILRFYRDAKRLLTKSNDDLVSIGDFLSRRGYSAEIRRHFVVPLLSSIWSAPPDGVEDYPAEFIFRFLDNHGLLGVTGRLRWRTIQGTSKEYVQKIVGLLPNGVYLRTPVTSVKRDSDGVRVVLRGGESLQFDHLVFACHSDQALSQLMDASAIEKRALRGVSYEESRVMVHTDSRVMPVRPNAWGSWNYVTDTCGKENGNGSLCVTYHINRLQKLASPQNFFVTVNPSIEIKPELVLSEFRVAHPQYTKDSIEAQQILKSLNGKGTIHFAGAYLGHGFHEDGLASGMNVAMSLGVTCDVGQL